MDMVQLSTLPKWLIERLQSSHTTIHHKMDFILYFDFSSLTPLTDLNMNIGQIEGVAYACWGCRMLMRDHHNLEREVCENCWDDW